jgi:phosphoribosylanthranilate isomerase
MATRELMIKVCGMKYPENISEIAKQEIDLMGFIFFPKSSRYVGVNFPKSNLSLLPSSIRSVGVFVNEFTDVEADFVQRVGLDMVQLHGNESPRDCMRLQEMDIPVIKAFSISTADDFEQCKPYHGTCDYFLFDSLSKKRGGSGMKFDWNLLEKYTGNTPFFLSGGISPDDAQAIIDLQHPYLKGVDINSRFEIAPARKNVDWVNGFCTHIRTKK